MSTPAPFEGNDAKPDRLGTGLAQRVAALTFRSRQAVEGLLSGIHKSPHRGASVVFVEHREYRPGDDLRLLDWRAFARTDRHHIKHFEQETQLRCTLVLDRSGSMRWNGFEGHSHDGESKDAYAQALLGAFAYLLSRQGDATGFLGFSHEAHGDALAPATRTAQLTPLLEALAAPSATAPGTSLRAAIDALAGRPLRRGLIAIASDLLDEDPEALSGLATLRARGHQVIVFHVLHPQELRLPELGGALFEGLEGEESLQANTDDVGDAYAATMGEFIETSRRRCIAAGAHYELAVTNTPIEQVLAHLVQQRRGRR